MSPSPSATTNTNTTAADELQCAGAVLGLTAVAGNNEVRLTWTSAEGFAKPTWFGVLVTAEGIADRVVRVQAPSTGTTLTGLRNGVEHTFTVYAVTAAGSSEPSETVRATPLTGMEGEVAGLIVAFKPGVEVTDGQREVPGEAQVPSVDLTIGNKVSDDTSLVELSQALSLPEAERVAAQLEADPQIAWAEPDRFMFTSAAGELAQPVTVPDDGAYATSQWNLWDAYGIGVGDGANSMTNAWANGTGEGATVAVIDTGITAHPDLDSQLVPGYDFVSNPDELAAARTERGPPEAFDADATDTNTFGAAGWDANPTDPGDWRGVAPTRDSTWHGTKVAGVIAAQARNGQGIAGVAPGAKIQPIRALSWRGGLLSDIAASITWASGGSVDDAPANEHPSDVINLSLSAQTFCPTALQAAIDGARSRGSVIVAAAGNANDDAANYAPGNCNGVITVAATDRNGVRAPYSNYGSRVDLSAPGGNVAVDSGITTTSNAGGTTAGDPTWAADQGTSLSAAHVSAAAALLKARNASLSPDEVEQALTGHVRAFASDRCDTNLEASCGSGILLLAQVAADACTSSGGSSGGYYTVTLTAFFLTGCSGTWVRPTMVTKVDVLVVGGGGGGGAWVGGGGGGGGVTELLEQPVSTNVAVVVGGGGIGAICNGLGSTVCGTTAGAIDPVATAGGTSSFGSISATGGGYGGSYSAYQPSGGANGGGGGNSTGATGSVSGSGARGGKTGGTACAMCSTAGYFGGGGAGAGADGGPRLTNAGGSGGNGASSTITNLTYGGGGGGGAHDSAAAAAGGAGGGGRGNAKNDGIANGSSGTNGTGGGGGGGGSPNNSYSAGGNGGQGTVVIRYLEKYLSVSAQPSNYANGAWVSQAPKIQLVDVNGNALTGAAYSGITVTAAFTASAGSGTLSNTTATTDTNGVATFNSLALAASVGTSGTLSFTSSGYGPATSSSFSVVVGPATAAQSTVSASPSSVTANGTSASTVTVTAKDVDGNVVSGQSIYFEVSSGTATLSASTGTTNASGVATVSVTSTTAGSVSIRARLGSTASATAITQTAAVTFTAGTATQFAVTGSSSMTAGSSQTVTVTAQDAYGNTDTSYAGSKSVTFSGATSSAGPVTAPTVAGTAFNSATSLTFASGVATASMMLYAAETALIVATQGSITATGVKRLSVTVSAAALAGFEVTNTSGGAITTQSAGTAFNVKVRAVDSYGNTQTSYASNVTLTSTSAISAGGGTTASLSSGVLASHSITLTTASASQTLTATGNSKTGTSSGFAITAASASKLVVESIASQTAGTGFSVTVTLTDTFGNAVSNTGATGTVTLTRATGGGTLSGTTSGTIAIGSSGTTITGVTYSKAESGVSLTAAGTGASSLVDGKSGTSESFAVVAGPATKLQVLLPGETAAPGTASGKTGSPTGQTAGSAVSVTVNAVDANWNVVSSATPTVAISSSDGNATLPSNAALVSGTKTFSVTFKTAGSRTVTATDQAGSSPLTAGASAPVAVSPGAFAALLLSSTSTSPVVGTPVTVTAQLRDAFGNDIPTSGTTITWSKDAAGGSLTSSSTTNSSGIASATLTASTVSGVATSVTGTSGSISGSTGTITTVAGQVDAAKSTLTPTAVSITANGSSTTTLTVTAKDQYGNSTTNMGSLVLADVVISKSSGTGTIGSVSGSSGVYTATVTSPTLVGQGVFTATLGGSAVKSGGSSQTQASVDYVAGSATKYLVTSSDTTPTVGSTVTISAQLADANGNAVATSGRVVTWSVPAAAGQSFSSATSTTNASGIATVSFTVSSVAGTANAVTATDGLSLTGGTATITTRAGPASKFVVSSIAQQTAGTSFSVSAMLTDSYGNAVNNAGSTGMVMLSRGSGSGTLGGTLTGTIAVGASSVTITGVTYSKAETGVVITATGSGAGSSMVGFTGDSNSFTVVPGAATKLGFTTQPTSSITAGATFAPVVAVQDANGNTVTSDSGRSITVALTGTGTLSGTKTVSTSSGLATFTALSVDTAGTGKTLGATATGLTDATSSSFAITPATASALTSTMGASSGSITADGSSTSTITVQLKDVYGNSLTTGGATVTVTTTAGTVGGVFDNGNGTYTATLTSSTTAGTATVSATVGGSALSATTTVAFVAGSPHDLAVVSGNNQSATVAASPANAITVKLVDVNSNPVPSTSVSFTVASGGGSLLSASATTDASGIATLPAWTLGTPAGTNTVTASVVGGITATITATGTAGTASKFAVTLSGGNTALSTQPLTSGSATNVRVTAQDTYGNTKSSWTGAVSLTSTAFSGTVTATIASNGYVDGVTITPTVTGSGKTVSASATGISTAVASSTFTVAPGALASFEVTQSGGSTALAAATAGTPFSVRVRALDAQGNTKTDWTGTVSLSSAAWSGSVSASIAANGYVDSVSITPTVAGTGNVVRAASGAVVTNSASGTFTVSAGTAAALHVATAPISQVSGSLLNPQPAIEIVDAYGNRTNSTASVTVAPSGGTLAGTTTTAAVNGLATFTDLVFTGVVGTNYTLTFSSGSFADVTSTISPSAAGDAGGLRFSVQPPASTVAGTSFGATVRVVDASGNTVTTGADATRSITLTVSSGSLTCAAGGSSCLTVTASGGYAAFSGLRMNTTGTARQLTASATLTAGASSIDSAPFDITAGSPTQLALSASATGDLTSGASRTFTATIQDPLGNTVDSNASVTFAATGAGSVSGLSPVTATNGVATVTVAGAAVGSVSITASTTSPALTSGAATLLVVPGAVASVNLDLATGNLTAGATRSATATLLDAYGNTVTGASNDVVLTKTTGAGSVLGTGAAVAAVNGIATFTLTGNAEGAISVKATATVGASSIDSTAHSFTVVPGAVTQIVLAGFTSDLTATAHRTFTATLKDVRGNVVTASTDAVTFAQTFGTGSVTGFTTVTPVNGVASITIDGEHAGLVEITASIAGPVTSNAVSFTVVHGAAAAISLTGLETDLVSGSTRTFTATSQDVHGNTVNTGAGATVAVTFSRYSGGGSVTGLTTVTSAAGVASVTVTGAAAGLVEVHAEAAIGGSTITSNDRDFTVVHGVADHLVLEGATTALTAGTTRTLTATVADAHGNTVTSATNGITFAKSAGAGTVTGLGPSAASAGVASMTVAGAIAGSVSIVASAPGLTASSAVTFTVDPGSATALAITTQPAGAVHATALTTQPVVRLIDVAGNTVPTSGVVVTAALASGSGTLTNATATMNGSGVASFSGLAIAGPEGNVSLMFSASGVSSVTSSTFALAKADQSVTFGALSNATYGDPAFSISATASSALPVTFTASPASVCVASGTNGSVISITGAGTCTVTAAQAGNSSFNAATSVPRAFTVAQATQAAVTIDSANSVVYGATRTLVASGGSGTGALSFTVSGTSTCALTRSGSTWTLTPGNAGSTCEVTATRAADTNYLARSSSAQTVTITKADQTIGFTSNVPRAPVPNGTYTPTAVAIASGTGAADGLAVTFTIDAASSSICAVAVGVVTFSAAGSCVVHANQSGDANHNAAPQEQQTILVDSLNQTITFPQPANVEFGSASVSMNATASSELDVTYALGAGTTNGACSVSSLGAVSIQAIGTCQVVADQTGDAQYAAASSVTRSFSVIAALPTAPHISSVSASDQSITVAYTEPGFTGGVALSAYQVTATPVGGGSAVTTTACSPAASPLACTIMGLTNGTEYQLSVSAINSAGTGPAATASTSMTPATAAFAVSGLIAQPGDTTLAINWTPLTNPQLGGGSFVQYVVSYRPASGGAWTDCLIGTTCTGAALTTQSTGATTITGLDNGTSYEAKIVALTTANGTAMDGNTATVTEYPSTTPSAPLTPTVLMFSATDVQFSWADPVSDGGSALSAPPFTVTVTSATGAAVTCTPSAADRHCHVSGLTNGAVYTFSVEANNRMGAGPAATTTYAVPSADATLASLALASGTANVPLAPVFTSLGTAYTASVDYATTSITVTATTTMPGSTFTINGVAATSGVASTAIALAVGETAIPVVVTASDPRHTSTYTITITRAAPPAPAPVPPAVDPDRVPSPVIAPITVLPVRFGGLTESLVLLDGVPVPAEVSRSLTTPTIAIAGAGFTVDVRVSTESGMPIGSTNPAGLVAPVGSYVTVDATGYRSGTEVGIYLVPRSTLTVQPRALTAVGSDVTYLGDAVVSSTGGIARSFAIPATMRVGEYLLQINGITTESEVRSVNLGMQLTTAPRVVRPAHTETNIEACSFEGSSISLTPLCRSTLRTLAAKTPYGATNFSLTITGVAYGQETAAANKALALKRAAVMQQYLTKVLVTKGVKSKVAVKVGTVTHQGVAPGLSMSPVPVVASADGSPATTVLVHSFVPATTLPMTT